MINMPLTILKENWENFHMKIIKEISDPIHDSEVCALVIKNNHLLFFQFIKIKIKGNGRRSCSFMLYQIIDNFNKTKNRKKHPQKEIGN